MSIPVLDGAAALAAALVDVAALIEEAGAGGGLAVTCDCGGARVVICSTAGSARQRAALLTAFGSLSGASRCWQSDVAGDRVSAWLQTAGKAGGTAIEITTPLAVRAVPGGTLAAGPDGQRAVVAGGQQPPPGWRWVTDLDDEPGQHAAVA